MDEDELSVLRVLENWDLKVSPSCLACSFYRYFSHHFMQKLKLDDGALYKLLFKAVDGNYQSDDEETRY